MIERRIVTRETLSAILGLTVKDDQHGFVAPNAVTIAQAAYEQPGSFVWGLWDGDTTVGLIAMIHPGEYPWLEPGDDPQAAYIWRLMIDGAQQGKGHGRATLEEAVAQTRAWGLPRLCLSVVDKEGSAIPFYESFGFQRTGRIVDGELEFMMDV